MKKILIVDNSSWNIYNFRMPLVKALSLRFDEVTVVTPVDEYIHYLHETEFIKHIACNQLRPRKVSPLRDLLLFLELLKIYLREKPDLIVLFTIKPNIFGNLVAALLGINTISVITGLGFTFLHPKGINQFIPLLYKIAFKRTKKVIFYNPDDRALFAKRKLVKAHQCETVPGSGIDTNYYYPMKRAVRTEQQFIFLFIGRLLKDKGLVELVEAAKEIKKIKPNVSCWVVGDFHEVNPAAIEKDSLVNWVNKNHIVYLGKIMDVRKVIKDVDVLVLPSYREGIPRVVLEAMAMEKPVITTDAAGCKETVSHGLNGLLVPQKSESALYEAMLYLAELQKKQLHEMGKASRKRVIAMFDEKIVVSQFLELVNEFLPCNEYNLPKTKSPTIF